MKPVHPARRRADEFSSLVGDSSTAGPGDTASTTQSGRAAELASLVDLVAELRATPPVEARPDFVADLRSRLVLAAETALVPETTVEVEARRQTQRRRTARERRLAVAVGGFALVTASASMSVAAQSALPGDTLYPLKRGLENVHERVVRDPDAKGATMIDNAEGRLAEVDELSRAGDGDARVISQTLQDFTDQAVEASDVLLDDYAQHGRPRAIEELRDFTADSIDTLRRLETVIPVAARSTLVAAARVLDEIDLRALDLCPSCGEGLAIDPLETASSLGPIFDALPPAPSTTPAAPSAPDEPAPTTSPDTPAPDAQPAPVPSAPAAPEPEVDEPATPVLPPAPTGDSPSGNGGPKNPLQAPLTTLSNPLGDLLTGTIEQTVDTVQGLLGGPPK